MRPLFKIPFKYPSTHSTDCPMLLPGLAKNLFTTLTTYEMSWVCTHHSIHKTAYYTSIRNSWHVFIFYCCDGRWLYRELEVWSQRSDSWLCLLHTKSRYNLLKIVFLWKKKTRSFISHLNSIPNILLAAPKSFTWNFVLSWYFNPFIITMLFQAINMSSTYCNK